ncbi:MULTISPECIES: hypothetical protein [unclassified Rhizobium]|uniref:hypothetical protein n=1 Tax=unclassified Rhizobium TaxID=2613769 RepID=UPI001ADB593B|nr:MULTISPECIES: hypothetical protein [unclassified Rhizobium]MBO9124052.1 hypothetical protein [Rhizobium sp. 16-488-2b]MBO9174584.1 hypothetical protein [Rhizobium sp. 16-488-2a]
MTQFENRQSEKVTETATEARQGSYGRPVLMVLVCSLVLALLAWGGVEMWGERQDTDTNPTASTKQDPINSQPSGPGAFDNNAADGSGRPPQATDRSPNP